MSERPDDNAEAAPAGALAHGQPEVLGPHGASHAREAREAALDLGDIDDDVVENPGRTRSTTWRRSAWVSALVVVIGAMLLPRMYGDFRFWISSETEVLELGHVSELMQAGELGRDVTERLVAVEGTPDVQSAARFTTREGYVGFLRLIESGTALFAAIPRETASAPPQFPTRFVGRMRRLDDTPARDWVRNFFAAESISENLELDGPGLVAGLTAARSLPPDSDVALFVRAGDGSPRGLAGGDRVTVSLAREFSVVQLGRQTWRGLPAARQAMTALGRPFAELDVEHPLYFSFVLEASRDEFGELVEQLQSGLDVPADNPHPNVGAMMVRRRTSHVTRVDELELIGPGRIAYPVAGDRVSIGWRVVDGEMRETTIDNGRVELDVKDIARMSIDHALRVGRHTHVVSVGELPSSKRLEGLLFLLVLGLVVSNGVTVARALLRSRPA